MASLTRRDTLIVPVLGPVYDTLREYAYPLLRIVVGFVFMPHGLQKLFGMFGAPATEQYVKVFGNMGSWAASSAWVYYIGILELVGGAMLVVGFLTRVVALQLTIFMLIATALVHWPLGFFWTARGFELPLSWFFICLFILIRGGGDHSVDRALGREF
jgi:putative oxidoreductase